MCVYLLHFSEPYTGNKRNPDAKRIVIVRHYIGNTTNLDQRISAPENHTQERPPCQNISNYIIR